VSENLLAAAPAVFAGREQELEAKIAALEAKLARKNAIIAEVRGIREAKNRVGHGESRACHLLSVKLTARPRSSSPTPTAVIFTLNQDRRRPRWERAGNFSAAVDRSRYHE
jgi:hypothetical protein